MKPSCLGKALFFVLLALLSAGAFVWMQASSSVPSSTTTTTTITCYEHCFRNGYDYGECGGYGGILCVQGYRAGVGFDCDPAEYCCCGNEGCCGGSTTTTTICSPGECKNFSSLEYNAKYVTQCLDKISAVERDDCIIAAAVNHSLPELCRNVSGLKSDGCYYSIARKEMNASYCGLIQRNLVALACKARIESPLRNYPRVLDSRTSFSDGILVVNFTTDGVGDLRAFPLSVLPVELGVEEPETVDDLQVLSLYCGVEKVFDVKDGEGGFALVDVQSYGSPTVRKTLLVGNYSCGSASRLSFRVLSREDALSRNLTIIVFMAASSGGGV